MGTRSVRSTNSSSVGQFLKDNILSKLPSLPDYRQFLPKKYIDKFFRLFNGPAPILLDSDGTVLSWNSEFEKRHGYKEEEILGQHLNILYMPLERQAKVAEQLLERASQAGSAARKTKLVRKDGTTFCANMIITPIRGSARQIIGYISRITEPMPEDD